MDDHVLVGVPADLEVEEEGLHLEIEFEQLGQFVGNFKWMRVWL